MKKEGFVYNLPAKEYHLRYGLNASSLKKLARDPFSYFNKIETPQTDAMIEGTLMHLLFCEPHLLDQEFFITDERKTAKIVEEANGRNIIKKDKFELMAECVEYVKASLKNDLGIDLDLMDSEVSFFGEFKGMKAKCRADKLTKDKRACFDLKKTSNASTKEFTRQACNLDYCIQEVFYREVMGLEAFNWIAICPSPLKDRDGKNHFRYNILQSSEEFQDQGKKLIDLALKVLKNKEKFTSAIHPSEFVEDDLDALKVVKILKPPLWYLH